MREATLREIMQRMMGVLAIRQQKEALLRDVYVPLEPVGGE